MPPDIVGAMKRIALRKNPDADALMAAWLAVNYLFDGEPGAVVFVDSKRSVAGQSPLDCTLGVRGSRDPSCLIFGAAVPDPVEAGETSVTRLLWEYLLAQGKPLDHLGKLVKRRSTRQGARQNSAAVKHRFIHDNAATWPQRRRPARPITRRAPVQPARPKPTAGFGGRLRASSVCRLRCRRPAKWSR